MKLRLRDYFFRPTDYLLALVVIVLILLVVWIVRWLWARGILESQTVTMAICLAEQLSTALSSLTEKERRIRLAGRGRPPGRYRSPTAILAGRP